MRGQGIPTGYAYRVKRATTMERCCMGVVSQIIDLDNSSSAVPYNKRYLRPTDDGCYPTSCRVSDIPKLFPSQSLLTTSHLYGIICITFHTNIQT